MWDNKFVCTKFFIYMFSIFFVLCSSVILAMSIVYLMKSRYDFAKFYWYTSFNQGFFEEVPITFSVISGFMIVIGLCAFGIALCFFQNARFRARIISNTSSHYMLLTFAILFLAILISLIATVIYEFVGLPKKYIQPNFQQMFLNYDINMNNRDMVNNVQRKLRCCGIYGSDDYENILHIPIPWSCCEKEEKGKCYSSKAFYRECQNEIHFSFRRFIRKLSHYLSILNVTVLCIAPVVVAAFVFAVIARKLVRLHSRHIPGEIHSFVDRK